MAVAVESCDCCVSVEADGRRSWDLLRSRLALLTTEATADEPAKSVLEDDDDL